MRLDHLLSKEHTGPHPPERSGELWVHGPCHRRTPCGWVRSLVEHWLLTHILIWPGQYRPDPIWSATADRQGLEGEPPESPMGMSVNTLLGPEETDVLSWMLVVFRRLAFSSAGFGGWVRGVRAGLSAIPHRDLFESCFSKGLLVVGGGVGWFRSCFENCIVNASIL